MKVVITGATGNLGTSIIERLSQDLAVSEIVGLARRQATWSRPRTTFATANVAEDALEPFFEGADAVIHVAWQLQPARDADALTRTNVHGSRRVFEAAARAGVKTLLCASSVAVYGPGPRDRLVTEAWDRTGIHRSRYSAHKVKVEQILDDMEPSMDLRVVRFRPALVFKREAASDIRRLFMGPRLPRALFRRGRVMAVPDHPRLRFQCVHSMDVGEAFRLALHQDVRGAFNLAAEPVITPEILAGLLDARRVRMPRSLMRGAVALLWRLRLMAASEQWLDMALECPLMDSTRARDELGWSPTRGAEQSLAELLEGLREGAGLDTPPMMAEGEA